MLRNMYLDNLICCCTITHWMCPWVTGLDVLNFGCLFCRTNTACVIWPLGTCFVLQWQQKLLWALRYWFFAFPLLSWSICTQHQLIEVASSWRKEWTMSPGRLISCDEKNEIVYIITNLISHDDSSMWTYQMLWRAVCVFIKIMIMYDLHVFCRLRQQWRAAV